MAKVNYSPGIEFTLGALDSEHKLVTRKKHLHDTTGTVTKECATEMYLKRRKRNYKQKPAQGDELAHLQHFGEAAKRTTALMQAYKFPESASPEELEKVEQYRLRFQTQLKNEPDPQAPRDNNGKQKKYHRFDNFIRAMIYQELKE